MSSQQSNIALRKERNLKGFSSTDIPKLRGRGQVTDLPHGGSIIVSSPNTPTFIIPKNLKKKPVELWLQADRIWLNM